MPHEDRKQREKQENRFPEEFADFQLLDKKLNFQDDLFFG
jgi:hypothetical protein